MKHSGRRGGTGQCYVIMEEGWPFCYNVLQGGGGGGKKVSDFVLRNI